ncbi:hypothetical protein OIU74_026302, partial [Salix koriyanagi]
MLLNMLPISKK